MSVSAQPWATIQTSNNAEQGLEQGEEKKQKKNKGKIYKTEVAEHLKPVPVR